MERENKVKKINNNKQKLLLPNFSPYLLTFPFLFSFLFIKSTLCFFSDKNFYSLPFPVIYFLFLSFLYFYSTYVMFSFLPFFSFNSTDRLFRFLPFTIVYITHSVLFSKPILFLLFTFPCLSFHSLFFFI